MRGKGFIAFLIIGAAALLLLWYLKPGGDKSLPEEALLKGIETVDTAREQSTQMNMRSIQQEILVYMSDHGRAPESLEQLPQRSRIIAQNPDAWGTRIRYRRISDQSFELISAGRDKEFNTQDDVVLEY